MNCQECQAVILEAADCGSSSASVQGHLTACAGCQVFFESQRAIHYLLCGSLNRVQLSQDFETRLRSRIHADRSLDIVRRVIASLEFAAYLLLGGAAVFLSALLIQLPAPDLSLYLPAIVMSIALTIVWQFVSGESASD